MPPINAGQHVIYPRERPRFPAWARFPHQHASSGCWGGGRIDRPILIQDRALRFAGGVGGEDGGRCCAYRHRYRRRLRALKFHLHLRGCAKENRLATIVGEKTAGRLLSATSVKVGHGFRLALPTGAYYTWRGTALEGSPIEPDVISEFDWQDRTHGNDGQFDTALKTLSAELQL